MKIYLSRVFFFFAEFDYYNRIVKGLNIEEVASTFIELRFFWEKKQNKQKKSYF